MSGFGDLVTSSIIVSCNPITSVTSSGTSAISSMHYIVPVSAQTRPLPPREVIDQEAPYENGVYAPLQRKLTSKRIFSILNETPEQRYATCPVCPLDGNYPHPHFSCDYCNPPKELIDACKLVARLFQEIDLIKAQHPDTLKVQQLEKIAAEAKEQARQMRGASAMPDKENEDLKRKLKELIARTHTTAKEAQAQSSIAQLDWNDRMRGKTMSDGGKKV